MKRVLALLFLCISLLLPACSEGDINRTPSSESPEPSEAPAIGENMETRQVPVPPSVSLHFQ